MVAASLTLKFDFSVAIAIFLRYHCTNQLIWSIYVIMCIFCKFLITCFHHLVLKKKNTLQPTGPGDNTITFFNLSTFTRKNSCTKIMVVNFVAILLHCSFGNWFCFPQSLKNVSQEDKYYMCLHCCLLFDCFYARYSLCY